MTVRYRQVTLVIPYAAERWTKESDAKVVDLVDDFVARAGPVKVSRSVDIVRHVARISDQGTVVCDCGEALFGQLIPGDSIEGVWRRFEAHQQERRDNAGQ